MRTHWIVCGAMVWAGVVCGADTAHHKAVYRKVQDSLGSMEKVTTEGRGEEGAVRLTGWISDGEVAKILAEPGSAGRGTDEIFLDGDEPLFVFSSRPARTGRRTIEERVYFRDGEIIEWLSTGEDFVPHAEDYEGLARRMSADARSFLRSIRAAAKPEKTKAPAGNVFEGVFEGIEEGDYAHWRVRDRKGREKSFFVLETTPAITKALDAPDRFHGRACKAIWVTRTENLPEAGGPMEIDVLLDVSWP